MSKQTFPPLNLSPNSIAYQLRRRILTLSVLTILGVFAALLLTFSTVIQQTQRSIEQINVQAAQQVDFFFADVQTALVTNNHILTLGENTDAQLLQILTQNTAILDIAVFDFECTSIVQRARANRAELIPLQHGDWAENPPSFGEVYVSAVSFEGVKPVIDVATLATDDISLPVGILVARLDLTILLETALSVEVGNTGYAYITDEADNVIAFRNLQATRSTKNLENLINQSPEQLANAPLTNRIYEGLNGGMVVGEAQQLSTVPWHVLVELPTSEAFVIAYWGIGISLIILIGIGMILRQTAMFAQSRILSPLEELSTAVQSFSQGIHDVKLDLGSQDEFGQLGNTFNSMANQIQDLLNNLEDKVANRTERLQSIATMSGQLNLIHSQEKLLQEIGSQLKNQFNYDDVEIFLLQKDEKTLLTTSVTDGRPEESTELSREQHPHHLAVRAAESGEITRGVFLNPDIARQYGDEIAVPILKEDQILGVFSVRVQEQRFDDADVNFFSTMANQIAIALSNAQLLEETLEAQQAAEIADKAKTIFLSTISHELKTPLNAILNFAEFIEDGTYGDVNPAQQEALQHVVHGGEHLLALLNDLLDVSRIEAGTMYLDFMEIDLSEIMHETAAYTRISIQDRPIHLVIDIEEALPPVWGDKKRIRQIFYNLASNAAKYTNQGSITITTARSGDTIECVIEDTGVGIHEEDHHIIFSPFGRGRHTSDKTSSTGLGLAITKELVELHHGTIDFQSELNRGSIFQVNLPIHQPETPVTDLATNQ